MRVKLKAVLAKLPQVSFGNFWLNSLLVFLAYLGMTVVLTYPVAFRLSSALAGVPGDSYQHLWSLWWGRKALIDLRTSLHNVTYLYYPLGTSHKMLSVTPLIQITMLPLVLLLGPFRAYNLHFLLIYAFSGLTMYWLCRDLIQHRWAAFIGGTIYAFAPTHLIHGVGHYAQIVIYWFPLYALFALRFSRKPTWKNAVLTGLFLALSSLVNIIHIAYFVIPFTVLWLLYMFFMERQTLFSTQFLKGSSFIFALAAILTAPFFVPFVSRKLGGALDYFASPGFVSFSGDLLGFFVPSPHQPLVQRLPALQRWSARVLTAEGGNLSESLIYLGILPLVLAISALFSRRRDVWLWAGLFLITALLSLGPLLKFNGELVQFTVDQRTSYIVMPYALLMQLPFYAWGRIPGRLAGTTSLALAVMAAYGVKLFLDKLHRPWKVVLSSLVIVLWIAFEYWVIFPYPTAYAPIPDFYYQLRSESGEFAILDYPIFLDRPYPDYQPGHHYNYPMYYQTVHERPLVGGFIWRWPFEVRGTMKAVNNLVAPENDVRPEITALDLTPTQRLHWLDWYNIRYVISHRFHPCCSHTKPRCTKMVENERQYFTHLFGSPIYEDDLISAFEVPKNVQTFPEGTTVLALGAGWHGLEPTSTGVQRWMRNFGDMYVFSTAEATYRLAFEASSFHQSRQLNVLVNEERLTTFRVDSHRRFVSPAFRLPAGKSTIRFETDSCIRPADDGKSGDTRCLSIQVADLELVSPDNPLPPNPVNAVFGDHLSLLGYDLTKGTIHAGSNITLTLFWEATESPGQDWSVFTHILDQQGQIVAQKDNMPVNNQYPTSWWAVGEIVQDKYIIHIPEDTSPGTYRLNVGLYLWQTGERLIISDTEDDHIPLVEIEVIPTN